MRRGFRNERSPAPRWLLTAAITLSALLHVLGWALVTFLLRPPVLDIAFELPMDVELGTSEALSVQPESASAPQPTTEPAPAARPGESDLDAGLREADQLDAAAGDASTLDAASAEAGVVDGGARLHARLRDASVPSSTADAGASSLPPGTQIAVRVDMRRIRQSPIAADVRDLLGAIPDWQALLAGSGIDPIDQLERLLIATPNLQRDKIVLAGRYLGGEPVVKDAVARLAAQRGVPENWHAVGNVRVATWASADATPRVIALIGPAHFVIARPEDLPRVLAIAGARAQRKPPRGPAQPAADALLSMDEGEGLSIEVEGAARFVRRAVHAVPDHLRLAAHELPRGGIGLRGQLTYGAVAGAEEARAYVTKLRESYARNTLVMLLGLRGPLAGAQITQVERVVNVALELSVEQTRLVLGYVRELLRPPAPPP